MVFFEWNIAVSSKSKLAGFEIQGEPRYSEGRKCSNCGAEIATGDWLPPHRIKFDTPSIGDFASNGTSLVLSERCVLAIQSEGVRGLRISEVPVTVAGGEGVFFAGFPEATVTRLDERSSGVDVIDVSGCDECRVLTRSKIERLRIEESTWDGKEVFRPSGLYGVTVVTQVFVDLIHNQGFRNFHFVHQDDFREDWSLFLC